MKKKKKHFRWDKLLFNNAFSLCKNPLRTNQEDGKLELVVEHYGVNTAGSREPGCYFTQEIGMKYKEDDARALSGRKKQERQTSDRLMTNQMDYKKKKKKNHIYVTLCCVIKTNLYLLVGAVTWSQTRRRSRGSRRACDTQAERRPPAGPDEIQSMLGWCPLPRWTDWGKIGAQSWFENILKPNGNIWFSPHESKLRHSHVNVVLYKVTHNKIVTELGKVHGCVLVFGQNVAVSPVLQQEAHYISVPPLASLTQRVISI